MADLDLATPVANVNGYAPELYEPEDAKRYFSRSAGKPYQPSNGSEGEIFQRLWCGRCSKDPGFEAICAGAEGCAILADTMCLSPRDPEYPREWQYSTTGQPLCRAFAPREVAHG